MKLIPYLKSPLLWMTIFNLCFTSVMFFLLKTQPLPLAVVDTQALVESQKVLWLRTINDKGQTQKAFEEFLEASEKFPLQLQEALKDLAQAHGVLLVNKGVLADETTFPDLTEELFNRMAIKPQAVLLAKKQLREKNFSSQGLR